MIVMLTDMDHISYKCHPYFSCDEGLVTRFGPFDVLRTEVEIQHGFQLSVLEVFDHRDNRIHRINHCWFRDWPEFHVPDAEDFVNFFASINQSKFGLNLAEKTSNQLGPVLVHCAGGVGRTGCYIAIDICSRQLVSEGRCPDVFDVVGTLRDLRMHSVEREEQYLFIHLVVSYFGFANKLACDDDHITFDQVKHILNIE